MATKPRIIIVSVLIMLGGALFYYCAAFYPLEIATQVKATSTTVNEPKPATEPEPKPVQEPAPEPAPVKQTSIETPEQDKSEPANQSPPERKPRPRSGAI